MAGYGCVQLAKSQNLGFRLDFKGHVEQPVHQLSGAGLRLGGSEMGSQHRDSLRGPGFIKSLS